MAITRIGPNQSINLASNITGTLPTGNGGTGATSFAPGKVLQVVQGSHATSVESTSTSYADAGLSASITPSATSSKVLVMVNQSIRTRRDSSGDAGGGAIRILRGSSTVIIGGTQAYEIYLEITNSTMIDRYSRTSLEILDSPSSTSSVTYKVQSRAYVSGYKIFCQPNNIPSIITLMEIAG